MKFSESKNILAIDDDEDALLSLIRTLKATLPSYSFSGATNEAKLLTLLADQKPEVVIMDLCIDESRGPESGYDLLRKIIAQDPTVRVIVITGYGSVEAGVKCLELGASSFIEKPPEIAHLSALIKDGVTQANLKRAYSVLNQKISEPTLFSIIGQSDCANKLREAVQYAANNNQSILISGETGTGKGLCALAIHKLSKRNNARFVRYQPSFGTADLVNSDLFGHIKGAFTGALANRPGLIEEARAGTLFLDEVDELPGETQVSLLGVLQEKKFRPLGSNDEIEADFRLIAATNQEIEKILAAKKLRQDFFHRVAHLKIHLPPLRERLQDIEDLADHFLSQLRESEQVSVFEISAAAILKLKNYSWPGNIRELQAVTEGGAYRAEFQGRKSIELEDLAIGEFSANNKSTQGFHDQVENFKLKLILDALQRNQGNQVKTAAELGMDRSSMRRIMERGGSF